MNHKILVVTDIKEEYGIHSIITFSTLPEENKIKEKLKDELPKNCLILSVNVYPLAS